MGRRQTQWPDGCRISSPLRPMPRLWILQPARMAPQRPGRCPSNWAQWATAAAAAAAPMKTSLVASRDPVVRLSISSLAAADFPAAGKVRGRRRSPAEPVTHSSGLRASGGRATTRSFRPHTPSPVPRIAALCLK